MTKDEVITFLKNQKSYLQDNYGVLKIGLFGSYAREEQLDTSDIDIAVELSSKNKADNYFGLLHFLEDSLHKKIDLGIESSLKSSIKKYIDKDLIYV